jgi:hypothetical protein
MYLTRGYGSAWSRVALKDPGHHDPYPRMDSRTKRLEAVLTGSTTRRGTCGSSLTRMCMT